MTLIRCIGFAADRNWTEVTATKASRTLGTNGGLELVSSEDDCKQIACSQWVRQLSNPRLEPDAKNKVFIVGTQSVFGAFRVLRCLRVV